MTDLGASIVIDQRTSAQLAALFDLPRLSPGDRLPPCWHWAMAAQIVDTNDLGADGHPAVSLPDPMVRGWRRMWGGSKLTWHQELLLGGAYAYRRQLAGFEEKQGRSGRIAVCKVLHRWSGDCGEPVLDEEQSIVYLAPDSAVPGTKQEAAAASPQGEQTWLTPVHLFRYSAATLNSHRIHYDQRYASEVEGYPALVVHGPLLATILAGWVEKQRGARLKSFDFRNLKPLLLGQGFTCLDNGETCEIRAGTATCLSAAVTTTR